jgi:ABC-type antimicrobial peptide transport system permease subunit
MNSIIDLRESLKLSIGALSGNRSRTVLTILSVAIGVASIAFCISAGESLSLFMKDQLASLGTDLMWVMCDDREARPGQRSEPLNYQDVLALRALDGIGEVGPRASQDVRLRVENTEVASLLLSTTPGYMRMRNKEIALGRSFIESDLDMKRQVCILGPTAMERVLYRTPQPIGQIVKIDGIPFTVVGILARSATNLKTPGLEEEDAAFIPLTTGIQQFGLKELSMVFFQPVPNASRDDLKQRIWQMLWGRKGWRSRYSIDSLEERKAQIANMIWVVVAVFASIAIVSLLVAGIGIMNIMMISVLERTREIGIRKSVGARNRQILSQFFGEALLLCGSGGLVGLMMGATAIGAVSLFLGGFLIISWKGMLLAFGFGLLIGITFGLYPSMRAAHLNPIVALARETS